MNRGTIYYDQQSGKLERGRVWGFDLNSSDLVGVNKIAYAKCAGDISSRSKDVCPCQVDKRHVTDIEWIEIALDLFGWDALGDFVPFSDWGMPIVSERFAKRIRVSKLTAWALRDIVKIGCNQSGVVDPKLFFLDFTGNGGRSKRVKVKGAANLCPHCGKVPMVCPSCGYNNWPKCIECDKWTLFNPDAPEYSDPKGFRWEAWPEEDYVVEGKDWDGSDFFCSGGRYMVSNRAKDWLERTHTFPIAFKPALLNIEGVEDKFKKK